MASLASLALPSSPAVFLPSRLPRPSLSPLPSLAPRRAQELPLLRFLRAQNAGLGFSDRRRRTGGWRRRRRSAAEEEDGGGSRNLEQEIYEFMVRSGKPDAFPTREELISAGRRDLADAVVAQGGWLAYGWNLDQEERSSSDLSSLSVESGRNLVQEEGSSSDLGSISIETGRDEAVQEDGRISQRRCSVSSGDASGSWKPDPASDSDSEASFSGRSMESEEFVEATGVEGILSRLEKERNLSLGIGSRRKEVNDKSSWNTGDYDPGETVSIAHQRTADNSEITSRFVPSASKKLFHEFGDAYSQNGTSANVNGIGSSPGIWRSWSLQRAGSSVANFEAAEIAPKDDKKILDHDILDDGSMDNKVHQPTRCTVKAGNGRNEFYSDVTESYQNQIRLRLQHLESDLNSALHSLRSRINGFASNKGQESSLEELHRLSDAWEFQETEIMNARDKLRSIRAKLAVLEGKMALEIIEAQKMMEEKQMRIDAAQKALHLLRTTCIVWPNPASVVLLAGSFDGWASQRRMDRSSTGMFSLRLKLYPGRYEIKFIADGVWKVDPLRPVVNNSGHENNLLIVP